MENNFVKITNAAYNILNFLPERDPLKNRAKDKVLAILENITLIFETEGWVSLQKEKVSRQLLDMLSKREKAQVADLIKELPSVTKRTIRRDLDDLLKKGKIVRVGEWNQVFYQFSR